MEWMIVVIFMNMQDVYIFTEPTFETQEECMTAVVDPANIPGYLTKMWGDYGEVKDIRGINCLQKDTIKEILDSYSNKEDAA